MEDTPRSHRMSLFLYIVLATLALALDFSVGLIPILGAMIGFFFCLIVSIELFLFQYRNGPFLRTLAGVLSIAIETFFAVPPTNFIFVTLVYVINNWKSKQQDAQETETDYEEMMASVQKRAANANEKETKKKKRAA